GTCCRTRSRNCANADIMFRALPFTLPGNWPSRQLMSGSASSLSAAVVDHVEKSPFAIYAALIIQFMIIAGGRLLCEPPRPDGSLVPETVCVCAPSETTLRLCVCAPSLVIACA